MFGKRCKSTLIFLFVSAKFQNVHTEHICKTFTDSPTTPAHVIHVFMVIFRQLKVHLKSFLRLEKESAAELKPAGSFVS